MTALETLLAVRARGGTVRVEAGALVVESDAPLPVALLDALRRDKPALLALLLPADEAPPVDACRVCQCRQWWQCPPEHGFGWVCGVCHPDPRRLATPQMETLAPPARETVDPFGTLDRRQCPEAA